MEHLTPDMNALTGTLLAFATGYGLKIVEAFLIFLIGWWITAFVAKLTRKTLTRTSRIDQTIVTFIVQSLYVVLLVIVAIIALGKLGVDTKSLLTVLAAAGLAVGLALKDSLSNLASGFLLLLLRPFKVGDYIEAGSFAGSVEEVLLFHTRLQTFDNKIVTIPNAKLTNETLINYSASPSRRSEITATIAYDADLDKAKAALRELVDNDPSVLKDPVPIVAVKELSDRGVVITVRVWVPTDLFWDLTFEMTEKVKRTLDKAEVVIAYPKRDVTLYDARSKEHIGV